MPFKIHNEFDIINLAMAQFYFSENGSTVECSTVDTLWTAKMP